ncbi:complement C1q tumor necrosis factor-related protein 3-like [Oryzias latipes]
MDTDSEPQDCRSLSSTMLLLTLLLCGAHFAHGVAAQVDEATSSCADVCRLQKDLAALTDRVVFTATTAESGAIGPFFNTNILFKTAITNVGQAYNPSTGIFTAPVNGIYYFSFFCHSGGSRFVDLKPMKNEEFIVGIYDHATIQDGADNAGNAAFVQLQQGDRVTVRLAANTHVWGYGSVTTFSGFLLS